MRSADNQRERVFPSLQRTFVKDTNGMQILRQMEDNLQLTSVVGEK